MARPATGKTPVRNVRVPDGLWEAAKQRAAEEGRTLTDVIVSALHRYVSGPATRQGGGPPETDELPERPKPPK